jgi:hypothetical protein
MIQRRSYRFAVALFALNLSISNVIAQPREISVTGPYVTKQTGLTFPEQAGAFHRVAVTIYSPDENDVSIGYNLMSNGNLVAATAYIYPARRVISIGSPRDVVEGARQTVDNMEMDSITKEILTAHRGARFVLRDKSSIRSGGELIPALHGRFAYEDFFAGRKQALLGDIWLCRLGKWYLKYRVTYPASNEPTAISNVKKLISALPVPHP